MKKIILFSLLFFVSCTTGKVGNTKTSFFDQDFDPPQFFYQLNADKTGYELIGIEENYYGAFYIEPNYNDPNDSYGTLPVTTIKKDAFIDRRAVFIIFILSSVVKIEDGAFGGWQSYQTIYFEVEEEDALFGADWDKDCNAQIVWGIDQTEIMDRFINGGIQ